MAQIQPPSSPYNETPGQNLTIPLNQPTAKWKIFLMIGGAIALVGAILLLFLSPSENQGGQASFKAAAKSTSESVAILETYAEQVQVAGVKNDTALMLILLRGTLQRMSELDKSTIKSKPAISTTAKIDDKSKEELDQAQRNNTLDDKIIALLQVKIADAAKKLRQTKTEVKSKKAIDGVNNLQKDLDSVNLVLNKTR